MKHPNILQRTMQRVMRGLFGITFGVPGANLWETALQWAKGKIVTAGVVDEPYRKSAVLATAISRIAEDAASVKWELLPPGKDTDPIEEHPLFDLWSRPNDRMAGTDLWVYTYIVRKLHGEAFWYYPDLTLGTTGGLRATAMSSGGIMLLDPRYVKHRLNNGALEWYVHAGQGETTLDGDRLTHFKRPNPYDLLACRGLPEIEALRMEIDGDYYGAKWNRDFFGDRNGIPAHVVIPHVEDGSTRDERRDFEERLRNEHRSGRRTSAVLPPGWAWQEIGTSPKDIEYRGLREYSREQILGSYGVPPFYAGVLDKANYANAREQKELYWLNTITRFLSEISGVLNHDFLPKVGVTDLTVRPNWEAVKALTENLSEKVETAGKLFSLGFTKRQINERLELGFDMDENEDADVGYLPFSVIPVSLLSEPRTPVGAAPVDDADEDDDEERRLPGRAQRMLSDGSDREVRRALVWRNLVVRVRDLENRMNAAVRRHMQQIEQEALEFVEGVKGWLARADGDSSSPFDTEEADRRIIRLTGDTHRAGLRRGGESVLSDLNIGMSFDMNDPRVLAKLSELSHKITRINATIERMLRASLTEGLAAGESVDQLAARVRAVMDASKARSFTIARTEVGFSFNSGRNAGMRQAGVERHEWLTARDSKVRDVHEAEDGQVVPIDEPFPSTKLLYPQDPSGPPGQIINCRCVALPVVE